MKMRRPNLFSTMYGHTSFVQLNAPVRLTRTSRSQSSYDWFGICAAWSRVAALLMRMSILPNCSLTFLNTSRTCSRLVTSILIASDLRPILRISSAVLLECTQPCDTATCASMLPCASAVFCRSGSSSTSTSVITTSAPWRASVSASWRPSPREAPVITATLPVRSNNLLPPEVDGAARPRDRARDDQSLYFRGAFPDLVDLRVAKPLLDRVLLDVPVSAEDLYRIRRHFHRDVAREAFGHRTFGAAEWHALRRHPTRPPDEQARGVDLHRHVGELETDRFVLPKGLSKLFTVLRVVERELVGRARDAEGAGGHARPCGLESHQRAQRPRACVLGVGFAAQAVVERDVAVLEDHLGRVAGGGPRVLLLPPHPQAGRVPRHKEGGDAGRTFRRVCVRVHDVVVRDSSVGAELLGSVEDVAIADASGARLHRQGVGTGVGLGQAEAAEHQLVGVRELRQPTLLLFLGAAGADARDRQSHRLDANADPGAAPAQLFVEDELGQEVQPLTAIFLG